MKISINDSEFVNLNYGKVEHCLPSLEKELNPLSISKGLVLSINDFMGPIEVLNSTFNKNMVFFPSAAYSNSPKFNNTVLDYDIKYFGSPSMNNLPPYAYLEMLTHDGKNLNHSVQFWNYMNLEVSS